MIRRIIFTFMLCMISSSLLAAAPAPVKVPKQLSAQVQRLAQLLRDSYAELYPDATMVQVVKDSDGDELGFVVFTIEGLGGGNSYTQYFSVFTQETNEKGKQYFFLVDVMPIGGKGWRTIENLNAKVTGPARSGETSIAIDALTMTANDALCCPSKKITIKLLLQNGRLSEQK